MPGKGYEDHQINDIEFSLFSSIKLKIGNLWFAQNYLHFLFNSSVEL